MGQTFVYNNGKAEAAKDEIHLSFGLFFDGTSNNRRNTQIRKKVQYNEGYNTEEIPDIELQQLHITDPKTYAQEKKTYHKEGKGGWKNLWLKSKEKDNSFANDFTNVARLSFCTEKKKYTVYIEGIGTEDEKDDNVEGLTLGSGDTGVRGKVRRGCELLTEKIGKEKKKDKKKHLKQITIDVFGFSRGAAAARNFVYEVNSTNKRPQDIKVAKQKQVVGYHTISYGADIQTPVYKDVYMDADQKEVNPDYLENGKMPKFGYLGYYLLSQGILSKEELQNLLIIVRFIGVYDTVASYDETYNDKVKMAGKLGANYIKNKLNIGFNSGIESLQLNNLGYYHKAVHFTAMDEHRLNFALTKFPGSKEKHLPGVHSDIGGSYNNMLKKKSEKVTIAEDIPIILFGNMRKHLISQHWFTDEQLTKYPINVWTPSFVTLKGDRELRKEYSYIPLHFMEEFLAETLGADKEEAIIKFTEEEYELTDSVLTQSKGHLRKYVFGNGKEWTFRSDEELLKEKLQAEIEKMAEKLREGKIKNEIPLPKVDNLDPAKWRKPLPELKEPILFEKPKNIPNIEYDENGNPVTELEELVITVYPEQDLLRKLRNGYLHWSADMASLGMDPTRNRNRKKY